MSGAEIIGLISGIVSIIDAALKAYDAATDATSLPSAFRDAAARLPLIQNTLKITMNGLINKPESSSSGIELKEMLDNCTQKATKLE